jgi:hypothetical protein
MRQTIKSILENKIDEVGYIRNIDCLDSRLTIRLSGHIEVMRKQGMIIATVEPEDTNTYDCRYYLCDTDGDTIRKIPKGYKIVFKN